MNHSKSVKSLRMTKLLQNDLTKLINWSQEWQMSPSVRPSVMLVHCIHMAEDIVKLLCQPGSPITLSFLTPSSSTKFQEEPLQRWRKIHGVGKF